MSHEPITKEEFHKAMNKLADVRAEDLRVLREERNADMREIKDILQPMADTYKTASTMGKWVMATAVFVSIMIGIILGLMSFLKK